MTPLVSVIIPTYNYAQFIGEAVESVLAQTYPTDSIEIIIVDDGSTDNTREALASYLGKDSIKYFYQDNRGKAAATTYAIKQSSGKYIFNLDADDYFFPNKISATVNIFESDETIVHVSSPALMKDEKNNIERKEIIPATIVGKVLDGNWLLNFFYSANMLFGGGTTYAARATTLKSISMPPGVDMYTDEFLILAILPFGKSYFIEDALSVWRVHGNNYSVGNVGNEKAIYKGQRLLNSSEAMLSFLKANKFDPKIVKIYTLQDLTRRIAFKESQHQKTIKDIAKYAKDVFIKVRPGWRAIKRYHVLNRLVPTSLFLYLKRLKS